MSGLAPSGFLQKTAEGLGPCGQGGSRRVVYSRWDLQTLWKGSARLWSTEAKLIRVKVNAVAKEAKSRIYRWLAGSKPPWKISRKV